MEDKEDGDEMHGHGQEGRKRRSRLELKDCVDTRMLRAMATSLNFTYVVREPLDGQWGYRLQNGSYTGVIGAVQRLEANFSLNVAFTGDRERVIDYTLGYYNDPLTFCTSPPRPLPRVLALVRPFHPEVWAGFVVVLVAVGSLYYAARKLENSSSSVPSFLATFLKIYGSCLTFTSAPRGHQ
ncbi:ionotropic receptor 40a-like isoform X3 [Scylla paramamosain]|uniref:ionotropic receptor 40a-like isoform X3 n=1 Tax=Scylla paramamosain TaxID=85552 RepID=UPI003083E8A1